MTPTAKGTPKVKSENLSDDNSLQKQFRAAVKHALQVEQQGQGGKGAKAKDGRANWDRVATFMMLAQLAFAIVHDVSRNHSGWPMFFAFI